MEDNFSRKVIPVPDRFSQARQNLVEQPQTMPTLTACVYLLLDLVFHAHEAHTVLQSEPLLNPNIDPYVTQMFNMTWEWVTRPRTSSELQCIVDMQCLCSSGDKRTSNSHVHGQGALIDRRKSTPGWRLRSLCLNPVVIANHTDTSALLRRRKQWPRSIHSYLPHGAAQTILGLFQWLGCEATIIDRVQVYHSLNNLTLILQPLVIPHLIATPPFFDAIYDMSKALHLRGTLLEPPLQTEEEIEFTTRLHNCSILVSVMNTLVDVITEGERMAFHRHAPAKQLCGIRGRPCHHMQGHESDI
jgi:hypothetical protein